MIFYFSLLLRLASDIFQFKPIRVDPKKYPNIKLSRSIIGRTLGNFSRLLNIRHLRGKIKKIMVSFNLLEDKYSKKIFIELISGYILGFVNVKLSINNEKYWIERTKVKNLAKEHENLILYRKSGDFNYFDLEVINMPIKIISGIRAVLEIFFLKQYRYNHTKIIDVEQGDIVIDAGAYVGDTALYFAHKVGNFGHVFAFEFVPRLIKLFTYNIDLNPHLKDSITLIKKPLWNNCDKELFYLESGSGSQISIKPFEEGKNKLIKTLTIDEFVKAANITKVDYIKMDVEGAEPNVLIGAKEVLIKYKPKLAISIYHHIDHFFKIPHFLYSLNLNYEFYIDHFNPHIVETILFAKIK